MALTECVKKDVYKHLQLLPSRNLAYLVVFCCLSTFTYTGLYKTTGSLFTSLPSYTCPIKNSGPMYCPPSTCEQACSKNATLLIYLSQRQILPYFTIGD